MTALGMSDHVLHGIQVASISLFTLFLQGKLLDIHVKYAMATEIPLDFTTLLERSRSNGPENDLSFIQGNATGEIYGSR